MDHVFLSDIDGTLVLRDAPLTREVVEAARDYTARGGLLSVCTGRSLPAVRHVAEAIGVNAPSILYGGAAIYDFRRGEYLYTQCFRWDVMTAVRAVLAAYPDISMQVFTIDDVFVLRRTRRLNERGVREENVNPVCDPEAVTGDVLKLVMCCDDPGRLEECRRFFPAEYCHFAFASRTFVDVVAAGFGKGEAMARLSGLLGIPFDHFFSAGDAITDLPMLRGSCLSFAPENALPAVKEAVTYVVPDVYSGGMAQAFRIAAEYMEKH
ncbi:MAG: HAD family phosphatase [Oscillospiraceae bacterium]|nr:HAD family phosphatase [Oscillospiraceae bacterium]